MSKIRHGAFLPTTLAVRVQQSVECVCPVKTFELDDLRVFISSLFDTLLHVDTTYRQAKVIDKVRGHRWKMLLVVGATSSEGFSRLFSVFVHIFCHGPVRQIKWPSTLSTSSGEV